MATMLCCCAFRVRSGWRRISLHRLATVDDHGVPNDEGSCLLHMGSQLVDRLSKAIRLLHIAKGAIEYLPHFILVRVRLLQLLFGIIHSILNLAAIG